MFAALTMEEEHTIRRFTSAKALVFTAAEKARLTRLRDALEHIVVIGSKVHRDRWRRQVFEEKEQKRASKKTSESEIAMDCPPMSTAATTTTTDTERPRSKKRKRVVVRHAEDLRIYGPPHPLPLPEGIPPDQQNETTIDDSEWNFEHGDSIPPILFRMARLSGEYPNEEEWARYEDNPKLKSLTSTNVTIDRRDVPRALIEKCWERAVHIASNAMVVSMNGGGGAAAATQNATQNSSKATRKRPWVQPFDSDTLLSQESCIQKCESLGVDMESLRKAEGSTFATRKDCDKTNNDTGNSCPRCTRSFSTHQELLGHYYGTSEATGCCRAEIRPKHLDLIKNLLQNYAESQLDQLATVVLSQNNQTSSQEIRKKNKNEKEDSTDDSDVSTDGESKPGAVDYDDATLEYLQNLGWRDVRRCLTTAVKEASTDVHSDVASPRHPVQESMHTITGKSIPPLPPLMLNPMILEAVNRRLIDRYADVPY